MAEVPEGPAAVAPEVDAHLKRSSVDTELLKREFLIKACEEARTALNNAAFLASGYGKQMSAMEFQAAAERVEAALHILR